MDDDVDWIMGAIGPCVALIGPADVRQVVQSRISGRRPFTVVVGDYDCGFVERTSGSDDESDDVDISEEAPMGIISGTWFLNRLYNVPAVTVMLFPWNVQTEWDDVRVEIISQFTVHRQCNPTRNLCPMVVIVREAVPLEDDVLLESQLTGIASELELSEDHVFLLSTWNVEESTKQFESRLFDNCVASYGESVKVLKRKRGRLGRQSHIYYLIRYHIKLGFLSLMSQDTAAAARFLHSAHKDLSSIQPASIFDLIEMRQVGFLIDVLIYRPLMVSGDWKTAIKQFEKHVREFSRIRTSANDNNIEKLRFAYEKWLRQEYYTIATLISMLRGTSDGSSENADLIDMLDNSEVRFLQQAAVHAIRRRDCDSTVPSLEHHYIEQLRELMSQPPFYFGQTPRYDEYDLDHVISCDLLVLPEASFDHSADIVTLLTMARKKLTSRPGPERTRQVLQLDLLLAKQHLHDQQYQAARPLLLKAASAYRREGWTQPLIDSLRWVRACERQVWEWLPSCVQTTFEIVSLLDGHDHERKDLQDDILAMLSQLSEHTSNPAVIDMSLSKNLLLASAMGDQVSLSSKLEFDIIVNRIELLNSSDQSASSNVVPSESSPGTLRQSSPLHFLCAVEALTSATHVDVGVIGAILRIPLQRQDRDLRVQLENVGQTVKIKCSAPSQAYWQEYCPLLFEVENCYDIQTFSIESSCLAFTADRSPLGQNEERPLLHGSNGSTQVHLLCYIDSLHDVTVTLNLWMGSSLPLQHSVTLSVVEAFNVNASWLTVGDTPSCSESSSIVQLSDSSVHVLHAQITNTALIPLDVKCIELVKNSDFFMDDDYATDATSSAGVVNPSDSLTVQFPVVPHRNCKQAAGSPGSLKIQWSRPESECVGRGVPQQPQVVLREVKPLVAVTHELVKAFVDVPASCELATPFAVTIKIVSESRSSSSIDVALDHVHAPYFQVLGPLRGVVHVPSQGAASLQWTLIPLQTGFVRLPRLSLTMSQSVLLDPDSLSTIFVHPCDINNLI
ncbi:Sm domain-containing protein [Plasmodiophora brassicae]